MQLFIVIDKALLGRGVFGVFSTQREAEKFLEASPAIAHLWEIRLVTVIACEGEAERIFAAYTHESIYDTYIFDGLYASPAHAHDAAGDSGLVVEFQVDSHASGTVSRQ